MDYKITAIVEKEGYLKLRGKLMMNGRSFSQWLREKISAEFTSGLTTKEAHRPQPVVNVVPDGLCKHGKKQTYCTIAKCENYAAWR